MGYQCPTCGRVNRDWEREEKLKTQSGHKAVQLNSEDRTAEYRGWRRNLGLYVNDIDQIEWMLVEGQFVPVAILELSRVDGNVSLPESYLKNVLDRITKRDPQAMVSKAVASQLGVKAWLVLFRENLREFWRYNLSDNEGWFHTTDQTEFRGWLSQMRKTLPGKPTPIFSKILNTTIYLTEENIPGKACYNSKEVALLKEAEANMTTEDYASYLKKIHMTKTTFLGSRIESFERGEAPPPEKEKNKEEPEAEPEPEQKSFWEL